jgi:hypothetical protein
MTPIAQETLAHQTRTFSVHAREVDTHHARLLQEASFEAAAVAYAEDFGPLADGAQEISVIVREVQSGHERCFRIDLQTGDASACG